MVVEPLALPGGVDLMNLCRWRGGRPAAKFSDAAVVGF